MRTSKPIGNLGKIYKGEIVGPADSAAEAYLNLIRRIKELHEYIFIKTLANELDKIWTGMHVDFERSAELAIFLPTCINLFAEKNNKLYKVVSFYDDEKLANDTYYELLERKKNSLATNALRYVCLVARTHNLLREATPLELFSLMNGGK